MVVELGVSVERVCHVTTSRMLASVYSTLGVLGTEAVEWRIIDLRNSSLQYPNPGFIDKLSRQEQTARSDGPSVSTNASGGPAKSGV